MDFPRIRSTFGVTPYNPDRDTEEKRRMIAEHYKDQTSAQPLPDELQPYNVPFPPGQFAQEEFDDMLQRRVVDPLAKAGFEGLGAGLAAVPSAAHSMIVPQTEFDVAGTLIPLPAIAKLMKKGKFRKISKAMHVEDPEHAAGIIAKQAGKEVPASLGDLVSKQREHTEAARKLLDPQSFPIDENGKKLWGPLHPASEGYRPIPGKEKEFKKHLDEAARYGDEVDKFKANEAPGPRGEVRAIDEKETFRKIDDTSAEKTIKKGIKEKYGIDGDNWSAVDSEADQEFGISDLSGKKGDVIEITDGDQTLQVLNDEYLDIMGLSGAIPIDETPFAQAMKTKVEPPKGPKGDPQASLLDELENEKQLYRDYRDAGDQEGIKRSLTRIKQIQDKRKTPKGDPEASLPRQPDKFSAIRSQLDVAPSRMDERGKAFGDVGQSDFTPYDRPSPQFEEIQKRNYVERDADPKEKLWKEIVANDPYLPDSPEYLQNLRNYFDNRWEQAQGSAEGGQMRMDLPKADRVKPGADLGVTSRYVDELAFKKFAKPYDKTRQSERPLLGPNDRTNKIDDKITDYFEGHEVSTPGRKLQKEMYKGRMSYGAEQSKIYQQQAKLFPKVKEAVKGKAVPKLFSKFDGTIVDENGKVVFTREEAERLLYEKSKDF